MGGGGSGELLDLQVDYWTSRAPASLAPMDAPMPPTAPAPAPPPPDRSERLVKKDSKSSLKTTFRCVQVYRLPQSLSAAAAGIHPELLTMTVTTKEKKQKSESSLIYGAF
jgi:hypothetical protein